jgi:cellulose biosynthesis protein BcsQ
MPFNIEWIGPFAIVASALVIASYITNRHLRKEIVGLRSDVKELRNEIAALNDRVKSENAAEQIAALTAELNDVRAAKKLIVAKANEVVRLYRALERRTRSQQDELARLTGEKASVEKDAESLRESNAVFEEKIQELESQIDGIKAQDGRLWQRPVAEAGTIFRPRSERGFPIISILNLKGGVGKTTITAHLAGTLGKKGKKALMLDLDYQRSLSMMVVPSEQRRNLHDKRRCLQHFLAGPVHGTKQLLECAHQVDGMPNCSIITNSEGKSAADSADSLEETEARLMAEWMVRRTSADVRLFLREALHAPEITRQFDCVLLDCPPRLTTATINALAASDFVLVPVVLDALSTRSLPELLSFLGRLRENLLPELSVLGVVANLTKLWKDELVQQELAVWQELQYGLAGVWGAPVPFFKTKIPNKSLFGRAAGSIDAGELQLALADAGVQKIFSQLAAEIEKEIRNHERVHAAAVPS